MKKSNLLAWGLASLALATGVLAASVSPNLDATLKAQRKLVDSRPNDAVAHSDLGNLLEESGDIAGAEAAYQKAIALDPRAVAAHFNLALLYQQQKQDKQAIRTLEQLLEIDGSHAWAHYQLGVLLEKKGRRNAAVEQYAQAFALDSGLSFPRNNPQILDSALSTESLLRAEAYLHTNENRVPRQFNDAARIRKMMLTPPAKEAAGEEIAKATPPEEGTVARPAAGAASGVQGGVTGTESAPRVLTNDDLRSSGGNTGTAASRSRARSTTTSSPRNNSNFAAPVSANPVYGAPVQRNLPNGQPVVQPADGSLVPTGVYVPPGPTDPGRPTLVPPPTTPAGGSTVPPERFRPGRRSTASLQWQLEPSAPVAG